MKRILEKYNVAVPRYTSYPPATFFSKAYTSDDYLQDVIDSNQEGINKVSFYFHIPFCHQLCFYCACNKSLKPKDDNAVKTYIEYVKKEFVTLSRFIDKSRKVSQIHFGGGSPSSIPLIYINEILELVRSHFSIDADAEIAIECHPGHLNMQNWKYLVSIGFTRISIGIQDLDTSVLQNVNRKPSLIPLGDLIPFLKDHKIGVNVDLIYGLPGQTIKSFSNTVATVLNLRPNRLVTFSYAHVPWVHPIQKILEKKGLPSADSKTEMYQSVLNEVKKHRYIQIGMDHFVQAEDSLAIALKNGDLKRNFQGYCTSTITGQVYAFGITGISQLHRSYAQNVKTCRGYYELLDKGILPINIGYRLQDEECLARDIITELMCNYRCYPLKHTKYYGLDYQKIEDIPFLNKKLFNNLLEDKIFQLSSDGEVRLNDEWKLFVRNVASCFDPHYEPQKSKGYSKPI